jgi:glycosyltransferase involved in cell wall biosynthesis
MSPFENVTILIPAVDETYLLRETVEIILRTCEKKDIAEFIFLLCEKSTRETVSVAEALVQECENIGVCGHIHYQTTVGAGGAIREGFELARGSHIIMMSSDMETDPKLVRTFIRYAKKYPDKIITASRWKAGGDFKGYNKIKLICNYIFEHAIAFFYLVPYTDLTFGYRIFPSDLMKRINWEESKHPFFLETALKPIRLKVKFIEIPAHWEARTEGVSQNSFFQNFKYFKTAWRIRFMPKSKILRTEEEGSLS